MKPEKFEIPEPVAIIKKHQESLPIDVIAIANEFGIKVWTSDTLGNQISGKLLLDRTHGGKSGYAIILNGKHANTRQRFTIAHELAHFILHRVDVDGGISEDVFHRSDLLTSSQETEANKLAADILMPISKIAQIRESDGIAIDDVATFARKFDVSEAAMSIRLGLSF